MFGAGLPTPPWMSSLLEHFIRQYIAGQEIDEVTLQLARRRAGALGPDFFRKVIELEQKYAGTKRIENDFQTNGVLLDESWCEFLKEHALLRRPEHRRPQAPARPVSPHGQGGAPTFDQVYRAARLLQQYEVPFNPMTVVNSRQRPAPGRSLSLPDRRPGLHASPVAALRGAQGLPHRRPRPLGHRPECRSSARRRPGRAIPIRWSPTGRSIPTTGASSSAGRSICGSSTAWARCWSTGSSRWWASGWASPRRSARWPASADGRW